MKILYATGRYSPLKHDDGSGTDYKLYHALLEQGMEIEFVGPFDDATSLPEKIYRKFHRLFTTKRPAKYSAAMLRRGSRDLASAIERIKPDLIFSKNLAPLVHMKTNLPVVYMLDSTVAAFNRQWPTFSKLENWRMTRWEKKVLKITTRVITRSEWTRESLATDYGYPKEKVDIVHNSSSLPPSVIPQSIDNSQPDFSILRLLLVGRVYRLKGIDIAIEIVEKLNACGIPAELRIVGLEGDDRPHVRFMGSFKKSDENQLREYASQYTWPHFLLHPARYDAAPIVTTEAAAFGIPTVTNAMGGIGSTVEDGISGVVLPALSPADEYVKVFKHYIQHPEEYTALRKTTRARYEKELNWEAAGKHIAKILQSVVTEAKEKSSGSGEDCK